MSTMENKSRRFRPLKRFFRKQDQQPDHSLCQFKADKEWLDRQYHSNGQIKKPDEVENEMQNPPKLVDKKRLDQIQGSLIGMAIGDALGAHVEFRPHQYLLANPVTDLKGGGTWGLRKGQFTDDTSMALCLANSLVACRNFLAYDQLVRYKWWYEDGYMSSTGHCFDIGAATRDSLQEFSRRQNVFAKKYNIPVENLDSLSDNRLRQKFKVYCSQPDVAGNGALMRLAPVPLFFNKLPIEAVEFSGYSGQITHGDIKAYDACRYYGALIVAALHGCKKDDLLDSSFYEKHKSWFNGKPLCNEIKMIAEGSYKKYGGYNDGIRGKGYIVNALEAALWAFWSDEDSFEKGALAAVNLGDDTDTTAAIYGQLAGVYYGYKKLPQKWVEQVYAKNFILNLSKWLAYEGEEWKPQETVLSSNQSSKYTAKSASVDDLTSNETANNHLQHQSNSVSITVLNEEKSSWRKFLPFFDNKKRAKRSAALATFTPKPQKRHHEPRLSADNLNFASDGRSKL